MPAAQSAAEYELAWRLATPFAQTWAPMVAVHEDNGPRLLRDRRLLDTASTELPSARSRLLADIHDVHEEEVTHACIQLRILEAHVRWHDSRAFVWRGCETPYARGEAAMTSRWRRNRLSGP